MFRQRGPAQLLQTAPKGAVPNPAIGTTNSAALPNTLEPGGYKRLGDMLVEEGIISEANLQDAIGVQRERGGFLGKLLVELGYTTEEQVVSCLVKQCKIPHLNLQDYEIDTKVFQLVSVDICRTHTLVPIDKLGRILTIAMVDPLNSAAIDAVRQLCPELRIKPILCSWHDYEMVLGKMSHIPKEKGGQNGGGEIEPLGSFIPQEMGSTKVAEASADLVAKVPLVEESAAAQVDLSQPIQHAGRSRIREVEEVVGTVEREEVDSISEEMLKEIVVSAVQAVFSEALEDIRQRLTRIEAALVNQPPKSGGRRAVDNSSAAFMDMAQSMRRSFGLDNGSAANTDVAVSGVESPKISTGVFEGLKISGPLESLCFEEFIGGAPNEFTLAVCKKVVLQPGVEYNPLFIFGPGGVGKTHLANAVGNAMLAQNPGLRVGYLPMAQFIEQLELAIRSSQLEAFRAHCASWSVLIFDDIDLLAGHPSAQEEMLYLVDMLVSRGCHLIFLGHNLPEQLKGLDSRLKLRLSSGLTAELKAPDSICGRIG